MITFARRAGQAGVIAALFASPALVGCSSAAEPDSKTPEPTAAAPTESADPTVLPSAAEISRRRLAIREHFNARAAALRPVATTKSAAGTVIDWVRPEENLAEPPPPLENAADDTTTREWAKTEIEAEPAIKGPPGTVPVVRFDVERYLASVDVPPAEIGDILRKEPPPAPASNDRYYVSWDHAGSFIGTSGTFSLWKTTLATGDTSISQTATFTRAGSIGESVEAGKIQFSGRGSSDPYFFTYYNTNNWGASGDWVGGYDARQAGWVQVSTTRAPGSLLVASRPGAATEIRVEIRHTDAGDWWVSLNNEWIGYYPKCKNRLANCANGTLFSAGGIRDKASALHWYGEIYDASHPSATITGMGSGKFPSIVDTADVAYFREMRYLGTANPTTGFLLPSSVPLSVTDATCYAGLGPYEASGTNYFYYGGPGKGPSAPFCR